jgi:valyl-tRNA synthetase
VGSQLEDYVACEEVWLELLDKWILSKTERLTQRVTEAFDKCQFNVASEEIRNFTWHVFCDQYLEAIKDRLYNPNVYGENKRKASQFTLYSVLYRIIRLLAPIMPHVTEEIYQTMYAEEVGEESLQLAPWPVADAKRIDDASERNGDLVMAVITEIRREKAELRKSLNTKIKRVKLYAGSSLFAGVISDNKEDIIGTCKISQFEILSEKGKGKGRKVEEFPEISFVSEY